MIKRNYFYKAIYNNHQKYIYGIYIDKGFLSKPLVVLDSIVKDIEKNDGCIKGTVIVERFNKI